MRLAVVLNSGPSISTLGTLLALRAYACCQSLGSEPCCHLPCCAADSALLLS